MSFEAHVTLSFPPAAETSVRRLADARGLGLTCIELARGLHPLQVMLTRRLGEADSAARSEVASIVLAARALPGTEVVRTKLELELDADRAEDHPDALYIEHHLKVRLPALELAALGSLASDHGAHLSRNPFRRPEAGIEERFLTQRFDPAASRHAENALAGLIESLSSGPWTLLKTIRELVVLDDNRALDHGWAQGATP